MDATLHPFKGIGYLDVYECLIEPLKFDLKVIYIDVFE